MRISTARAPVQVWSRDSDGVLTPATITYGNLTVYGPIFANMGAAEGFLRAYGDENADYVLVDKQVFVG